MSSKDNTEVARELAELRRGRGLDAVDLHMRAGPALRAACDIADSDTPAEVRRKLVLRLTDLCGRLPKDLQLAALAALALHEEASGEFLDRRIAWLASQYDRDPRTARRRIGQAFALLAEHLEDGGERTDDTGPYASTTWYVEWVRSMLRLDIVKPVLLEERRIVATVDELDEIVVSLSAPREADSEEHQIDAVMMYGGEIVQRDRVSRSHARFVVRLPRPLRLGQRHEYGIEFAAGSRAQLRPYYVLAPLNRCEYFSLRVHFGNVDPPDAVWRLNGVPPRVVDDFQPTDDLLTVDPVGDVHSEFHVLRQGLCYGIQWRERSDGGDV